MPLPAALRPGARRLPGADRHARDLRRAAGTLRMDRRAGRMTEPLLRVEGLVKHYPVDPGLLGRLFGRATTSVQALNGVSLDIARGETIGLIGESGCGKTTLGRTILRLQEPTAGRMIFDGTDITALPPAALKPLRRRMQIVFQNPYASLNPRRKVGD